MRVVAKRKSILGARSLVESEVDLINRVLEAERAFLQVHSDVVARLASLQESKSSAAQRIFRHHDTNAEKHELDRFHAAEPFVWAKRSKEHIQLGVMALVRSISQPSSK